MRKSQVYDFCFLFNQMSVFFLKIACHAKMIPIVYTAIGDVAKLVDALDLGSSAARRGGSTPFSRTRTGLVYRATAFQPFFSPNLQDFKES